MRTPEKLPPKCLRKERSIISPSTHWSLLYPTNYKSVVEAASRALGKGIRIERIPFERSVGMMAQIRGGGPPDAKVQDALERLQLYYNRRGLLGNPNVTEWLLGRRPTTLEDFIERAVKIPGLG
ncbi:hypothetical protein DTO212C5_1938 [Paecilomyces variotii]|nr:hypothetical protein DTO212C5_1938 [Paecilomyces variotii]